MVYPRMKLGKSSAAGSMLRLIEKRVFESAIVRTDVTYDVSPDIRESADRSEPSRRARATKSFIARRQSAIHAARYDSLRADIFLITLLACCESAR